MSCNNCEPNTVVIEVPAPPECTGEPCVETTLSDCVRWNGTILYNGFSIPANSKLTDIVLMLINSIYGCTDPTITVDVSVTEKITVNITNASTPPIEVYEMQYKLQSDPNYISVIGTSGQTQFVLQNLTTNDVYEIKVRKICDINNKSSLIGGTYIVS